MITGGGYENIFKQSELKKRLLATVLLLLVYRVGIHVPTPGIDRQALLALFASKQGTLFSMFDMFAGGALSRLSVFALGIMPYITAAIIFELLQVSIPYLQQLKKEGEQGRQKLTQYTRYATVGISLFQGIGISIGLERMFSPGGAAIVLSPGWSFRIMTMITLTAGTVFIMWLGEQITERGVGNGISLIIFAGIVARLPAAIANTFRLISQGEMTVFGLIILVALMVGVIAFIVFMEQAQRRIPVHYAKRVVGRKMFGGQNSHLPLKINSAGVIPPIFASSIMMFPATIENILNVPSVQAFTKFLAPGTLAYNFLYIAFIIFFCFFYTAIQFNPEDLAENLKKGGGYVPGVRPGRKTSEYLDKVITRLTLSGSIYISAVCILPTLLISKYNVPFYFGGTALLIVVGVAIDTVGQVESHLINRNYQGFLTNNSGDNKKKKTGLNIR
ncbi:MAG: preprotein translocase subunit SecY [Deltaproteobacteria bacterium]|nr:MAG: preprotein translocase subunit SecY [Deltaproteobacteria bacterium]PIE75270.1 MAG: preprotein translocase subunit SecY [Deltaproteobacteria bacterium]